MALNSNQSTFAADLSQLSGLDPRVIEAWELQEGNPNGGTGAYNFLNIKAVGSQPFVTNPKTGNSHWATYASVGDAATAAWTLLQHNQYAGIRASAAGTPTQQMSAIGQSPWDGGHYQEGGGAPGSALEKVYAGLTGTPVPSATTTTSTASGGVQLVASPGGTPQPLGTINLGILGSHNPLPGALAVALFLVALVVLVSGVLRLFGTSITEKGREAQHASTQGIKQAATAAAAA